MLIWVYKKIKANAFDIFSHYKLYFMYTSYHFTSAQEISDDIIRSIKEAFKAKPVTIIVEEEELVPEGMTTEMVEELEERLHEGKAKFIDATISLKNIRDRYGLPN